MDFRKTIEELFARLRLGSPRFAEDQSVTLVIDGISVVMTETGDERGLSISAPIGRLAADRYRAEMQVRRILGLAAGLVVTNGSVIMLEADAADPKPVLARHRHLYGAGRVDRLIDAVQDVLQAVEILRPELEEGRQRPAAPPPRDDFGFSESVIFRP